MRVQALAISLLGMASSGILACGVHNVADSLIGRVITMAELPWLQGS